MPIVKAINPAKIALGVTALGSTAPAQGDLVMVGLDDARKDGKFFSLNASTGAFQWLGQSLDGLDLDAASKLDLSGFAAGAEGWGGRDEPAGSPGRGGRSALRAPSGPLAVPQPIDVTPGPAAGVSIGRRDGEVTGIAYARSTNRLFGFLSGTGVVEFDQDDPSSFTTRVETGARIEGLAVSEDGGTLFGASGTRLHVFDLPSMSLVGAVDLGAELASSAIRNLGTLEDGRLGFVGHVEGSSELEFAAYRFKPEDLAGGSFDIDLQRFDTPELSRVDSLTFAQAVPPPASVMLLLAGAISASGRPRRAEAELESKQQIPMP